MLTNRFLFYPVYLFFFLFLLDKLFLLPVFHKEFLQAGNSVFYFQRKILADRMIADPKLKDTKLALVFGDSRSYPFSDLGIPAEMRNSWSLYNFSGPQAIPMYSYITFKDLLERGAKPSFVILSISPEAFDDSKGFIKSPFLRLGCNDHCITEVWKDLPLKDKYEYVLDRVFSIRSIELNLELFISRLKKRNLDEYKSLYNPEFRLVNYTKGEYLMYATLANPVEKLERDTKRVSSLYMRSYTLGESQLPYIKKFLRIAKDNKIPALVVWPKVYPKYYEYFLKYDLKNVWWKKVEAIASAESAMTQDMNEKDKCDLFNDASHQSVFCFVDQMKMIWENFAPKGK